MEMFQQLLAVAGVLGALCIVVWALKRKGLARINFFGPGGSPRGTRGLRDSQTRLEVLDRLVLTPHHSIHLIRLADRTLLVGLSPSGCNLLETAPAAGILRQGVDQ
jgi:flagellar biogenesis protein FliO